MPSYGYDGPITADVWAIMQQGLGTDYACASLAAGKVTATNTGIQVAAGVIAGWGVLDVITAPVGVSLTAPGSGQSWWMIVARRTWGSTKATTFVAIPAGTVRPSVLPTRNTNPGTVDDQPLALVGWAAGSAQPTGLIDLRVCGMAGQQVAFDAQTRQYLDRPGRQIRIGSTDFVCGVNATTGALEWTASDSSGSGTSGSGANGSWRKLPDGTLICSTTHTFPGATNTVQAWLWNYPVSFVETPSFAITPGTTLPHQIATSVASEGATSAVIEFRRTTSTATTVRVMAIGRWK